MLILPWSYTQDLKPNAATPNSAIWPMLSAINLSMRGHLVDCRERWNLFRSRLFNVVEIPYTMGFGSPYTCYVDK